MKKIDICDFAKILLESSLANKIKIFDVCLCAFSFVTMDNGQPWRASNKNPHLNVSAKNKNFDTVYILTLR